MSKKRNEEKKEDKKANDEQFERIRRALERAEEETRRLRKERHAPF